VLYFQPLIAVVKVNLAPLKLLDDNDDWCSKKNLQTSAVKHHIKPVCRGISTVVRALQYDKTYFHKKKAHALLTKDATYTASSMSSLNICKYYTLAQISIRW